MGRRLCRSPGKWAWGTLRCWTPAPPGTASAAPARHHGCRRCRCRRPFLATPESPSSTCRYPDGQACRADLLQWPCQFGAAMQKAVLFMGLGRAAANPLRRAEKSCRSRRRGGGRRFMLELGARLLDTPELGLDLGGQGGTAALRGTQPAKDRPGGAREPSYG